MDAQKLNNVYLHKIKQETVTVNFEMSMIYSLRH